MKKKNGDKVIASYDEEIEVKLDDEQVASLRTTTCDLQADIDRLEDELKSASKAKRDELKELRKRRRELLKQVKAGAVKRTLKVEEYLTATNEIIVRRADTGTEISRRTATADELQESLPGTGAPPRRAGDADADFA